MITITAEDPSSLAASILLEELSVILSKITGNSGKSSFDPDDVRTENARFVVARDLDGHAIGCGAFRPLKSDVAEVKRMYSRLNGSGVGTAILAFLEVEAKNLGFTALRLETRLVNEQAVRFYERRGYKRIANFGKYVGNVKAVCFEKQLSGL
ncbi:GNAT family N-acetyltransferase [Undibacterium sp. SXout11W]|uniref:GNAT family N-acetyltransferase n=1 Tax=Undibacterium sp. SXout11W TaxID=3413050 RepID=UPI003BF2B427